MGEPQGDVRQVGDNAGVAIIVWVRMLGILER